MRRTKRQTSQTKCMFRNSGTPPVRRKNVGNFKNCTFKKSGTPVCRTKRRRFRKMDFQDFWDPCAQNKTSEISKKNLGLLCAEQNVGNLNNCTFINSGTPVRREGRPSAAPPPSGVSFVLALNKAHVLALNTAHVLRL